VDESEDSHAAADDHLITGLAVYLGKLCYAVLKWEQQIRMTEDHPTQIKLCLGQIWRMLYRYCQYVCWDFHGLVIDTAMTVTRRNWIASPDKAHLEVK
jgi:hypothetical protein